MVPKEAQIVAVFSSSYSCLDNIIVINQRSKTQIVMFVHQRACKLSLLTSFLLETRGQCVDRLKWVITNESMYERLTNAL